MFKNMQKEIQQQIFDYCDTVLDCLATFEQAVRQYCDTPDRAQAKETFQTVHKAESRADDMRRNIEVVMYTKALFPESRGDILRLLETMDRVPNQAEAAVRRIWNQHTTIPQEYHARVLRLVDLSVQTGQAMVDAVRELFTNYTNATVAVGRIDELESDADHVQNELIENIFAQRKKTVEALLLRDLVDEIAHISDRAEVVGDHIRITVAKRTI